MSSLLLTLFEKYSQLLKERFSEDFLEIVSTDDYMPMPINSLEEYDKVVSVSWYNPDKSREELTYVPFLLSIYHQANMFRGSHSHCPSHKCTLCAA
jgi:hypothetical protein